MAKAPQGLFGPFTGKIGNVVCYILNGEAVVRSLPRKRRGKKTLKEKKTTTKFGGVQKWMRPLKDFVRVGFKDYGTKTGGYKGAVSYALLHAVDGEYPNLYVNPEKVSVSGGELAFPVTCGMFLDADLKLGFSWDAGLGTGVNPYDQAMLLAYCTENKSVISKVTGAFRMDGVDFLQLFPEKEVQEYHVYLGFVAQDRSCQANSRYLGTVLVP
ncbi:DUF6266 family protein [Pedobacter steynii]